MTDNENEVANGLQAVARAIQWLGNADAATPMGGLEALGKVHLDANQHTVTVIADLADAVREAGSDIESGLTSIADAIRKYTDLERLVHEHQNPTL